MGREIWIITYDHLNNLIKLLDTDQMKSALKAFLLREQNSNNAPANNEEEDEDSEIDGEDAKEKANEILSSVEIEKSIMPSLANFMEKLDYELLKAFQNTHHTKIEYL